MAIGVAPWQDYVLGDQLPSLAMVSTAPAPTLNYDDEWQLMVEDTIRQLGGRPCTYNLSLPSGYFATIVSTPLTIALRKLSGETPHGQARIIKKAGFIAAREWRRRGCTTRPQRGDEVITALERFYVEDVKVSERPGTDGVVRDIKYRLALTGASHRRA
jgi:hypothetical protein